MAQFLGNLWRLLGKFVSTYENILLAGLSVVIIISGTIWYRQYSSAQTDGPTSGGSYVEGIVGSQQELNSIATKLTKAGLFSLNEQGELENLLVNNWQRNDEATEFTFELKDGIDAEEIVSQLEIQSDILGAAVIGLEGGAVAVKLSETNPSLPLILTQPMFNYGPYKLSKSSNGTSIFTRNTRENAAAAYINKIIIHNYDSEAQLSEALERRRLDGAVASSLLETPDHYEFHPLGLNRYFAVVFNINRAPLRDGATRQAIINEGSLSGLSMTLTVPDQEPQRSLAEEIAARWRSLGADITVDLKTKDEILLDIGPSRNFQALVVGLDYGVELDPFYIWHSSQLRPPGNNLSGIKSSRIDETLMAIRSTLNLKERREQVKLLHELVHSEGAGIILRQETVDYFVSDNVRFIAPFSAVTATDRFHTASRWSVR